MISVGHYTRALTVALLQGIIVALPFFIRPGIKYALSSGCLPCLFDLFHISVLIRNLALSAAIALQ